MLLYFPIYKTKQIFSALFLSFVYRESFYLFPPGKLTHCGTKVNKKIYVVNRHPKKDKLVLLFFCRRLFPLPNYNAFCVVDIHAVSFLEFKLAYEDFAIR